MFPRAQPGGATAKLLAPHAVPPADDTSTALEELSQPLRDAAGGGNRRRLETSSQLQAAPSLASTGRGIPQCFHIDPKHETVERLGYVSTRRKRKVQHRERSF